MFVSIGEAAKEQNTGVVFLLDEVQFLQLPELEALIAALHKTVQLKLAGDVRRCSACPNCPSLPARR